MQKYFVYLSLGIFISSCGSQKSHKESQKLYKAQLEAYKSEISKTNIDQLTKTNVSMTETDNVSREKLNSYRDSIMSQKPISLPDGINTEWINTINFNLRKPNFIIIHHTAQDSIEQTIKTFTSEKPQVSAHYIIGDDGKVIQMLNDYLRAWHAGAGSWGRDTDINSSSIGIELDNDGTEPFPLEQFNSLLALLAKLKKDYNIPAQNIIGHGDIAPGRKQDPSALFPWKALAISGFGIWQDEILKPAPKNFDPILGLQIIGYNTKNISAAIIAFKRHYIPTEINTNLDEKTIDTIYSIYKKL